MEERISIRQFLENYEKGMYNSSDTQTQIKAGWYDWFCKDSLLARKTKSLVHGLKQIKDSKKINLDTMYVFFKNNCPLYGHLYDDFRICDLKSGNVIYTITPASGHKSDNGAALVYGRENDFKGPLVTGTWKDVRKFFMDV